MTLAQFGNRSGGTNSAAATVDDSTRSNIADMVARLTGGAASSVASIGASSLGAGMGGEATAFGEAKTQRDQVAQKWNDIFNSISGAATAAAGMPGVPAVAGKVLTGVGAAI